MNKKNMIIIIIAIIVLSVGGIFIYKLFKTEAWIIPDAERFKKEYPGVTENNPFVYKTDAEIIKILSNGTGIVYLGYPECPWCQEYVVYLNQAAKDLGLETIYYFNIKEDRANNTKAYQEIVALFGDNLDFDNEGNPRIYVPDVTAVRQGEIIGHDNETSLDTKGYENPQDYWKTEGTEELFLKLKTMISEVMNNPCSECNLD